MIEFFQVGLTIKEEQDDSLAQAVHRRPSQSAVQGILPGIAAESGDSRDAGYRQGPEAFSVGYERHRSSIPQVPAAVGQKNLEDGQLKQGGGDGRELGQVELDDLLSEREKIRSSF